MSYKTPVSDTIKITLNREDLEDLADAMRAYKKKSGGDFVVGVETEKKTKNP